MKMQSNRTAILAIVMAFVLLSCVACSNRDAQNSVAPSSSNAPSSQAEPTPPLSSQSEQASPSSTESAPEASIAYNADTEKYYDYFEENNHVSVLLGNETGGEGFSDEEMAAYAIIEIMKLDGYVKEYPDGFSKEDIDAITMKYFGTTIKNYNNRITSVDTETGNITSIGWSGTTMAFVLKELTAQPDGKYTGEFYSFGFGMGEYQPSQKIDLLRGLFSGYEQPYLVKIVRPEAKRGGFQKSSPSEIY